MGHTHEVTFKVKHAIIQTRVFHTKKEHMRSYIISVVYIHVISYLGMIYITKIALNL